MMDQPVVRLLKELIGSDFELESAAMEPALQNIGSGRQSPQEALDAAARRMRQ